MEVRDTKMATSGGELREISRKTGEYKSDRLTRLIQRSQSSKAMKKKCGENGGWRRISPESGCSVRRGLSQGAPPTD